jgi:hypothetical protein
MALPTTLTLTPLQGDPLDASVTFPLTVAVCAKELVCKPRKIKLTKKEVNSFIAVH